MGVLTSIISWVICLLAISASIGITAVLWVTYYDIRKTQDAKIKYSYFDEFLRNETAIYAMAIIATIIMVLICFLSNKNIKITQSLIVYLFSKCLDRFDRYSLFIAKKIKRSCRFV